MVVNRKDLAWFITSIKHNNKDISDADLVEQLAGYMETSPSCVDMKGVSNKGRYWYSTVGYGVFSLLGEFYRMGRVEIFDREDTSGYAIGEGTYCMPHIAAAQFEDFIQSLQTDFPLCIELGSVKQCSKAVSERLEIPVDKLNDLETKKDFYKNKYKEE
jgi:hypothetical protein